MAGELRRHLLVRVYVEWKPVREDYGPAVGFAELEEATSNTPARTVLISQVGFSIDMTTPAGHLLFTEQAHVARNHIRTFPLHKMSNPR
jgi:hypothetical protein